MSVFFRRICKEGLRGCIPAMCFFFLSLFTLPNTLTAAAPYQHHFPLRPFFPTVVTINTHQLFEMYSDAILIDVRSEFEFEVIHINEAENISLSEINFIGKIRVTSNVNPLTPLVFYCNDSNDKTAFMAALLAQSAGLGNILVYDAGIFPLLALAPEKISLMANTPARQDLVIPKELYDEVRIGFDAFRQQSYGKSALVIDIRDTFEDNKEPQFDEIRHIPMESFLKAVSNRIWAEKKLLIFDQTGEDTQWLQFFLQANGYFNYVFLRGGVDALDKTTQVRTAHTGSNEVHLNQQYLLQLIQDPEMTSLDIKLTNLLLSLITAENRAAIKHSEITNLLGCTQKEFEVSINHLKDKHLLLWRKNTDSFLFRINPRLGWKGRMSDTHWANNVKMFTLSRQP